MDVLGILGCTGDTMFHFVIGPVDEDLVIEYLIDGDPFVATRVVHVTIEALLVQAGIFKSLTKARKAGFTGPVPFGVHDIGTKKHPCWVWRHPLS